MHLLPLKKSCIRYQFTHHKRPSLLYSISPFLHFSSRIRRGPPYSNISMETIQFIGLYLFKTCENICIDLIDACPNSICILPMISWIRRNTKHSGLRTRPIHVRSSNQFLPLRESMVCLDAVETPLTLGDRPSFRCPIIHIRASPLMDAFETLVHNSHILKCFQSIDIKRSFQQHFTSDFLFSFYFSV